MINLLFQIVVMSMMASIIFIVFSILRPLSEKKCTTKWQVNFLKVIMLVFVFPISKMVRMLTKMLGMEDVIALIPRVSVEVQNHTISKEILIQEIQTASNSISIINAILLIWILGIITSVLWAIYCNLRFSALVVKNCRKADNTDTIKVFEQCKTALGVKSKIEVLESEHIKSPMLIGIFSPRILLPKYTIVTEQLAYVISHELIHLKRKDLLWKKVLLAVKILHWFNPLIYLFTVEFDKYIEYLCDEMVVDKLNHADRKKYGFAILESAYMEKSSKYSRVGVGFARTEQKIERRLTNMLKSKKMKKSSKIMSILMAGAIMATMSVQAFASVPDGEVSMNTPSSDSLSVTQNGSVLQTKALSTDSTVTVNGVELGALDVDGTGNIIDSKASGSLSGGSVYTSSNIYFTAKDNVLISITNTKGRDMFIGLKSVATGKVYGSSVKGGDGSITLTVNTSGNYKLYVENQSTGSTSFSCDYVVE